MNQPTSPLRIIRQGPGSPSWNMGVDESLLHQATSPILRFYQWETPAISLGYFQPWALVPDDRPFVRRYTGGGVVDHASDCTYTVVAPRNCPLGALSTAASYELIHRAIATTLNQLTLAVELTPVSATVESSSCFQKPVKFDLLLDGVKVAGAAQRRTRQSLLHQGSILLPDSSYYQPLRELLPRILAGTLGLEYMETELTSEEASQAGDLMQNRYSQVDWNQER